MNLFHCLTIDIEEHFQVTAFDSPMRRRNWNQFESRVQRTTERLLAILEKENGRATFFVLGWVAERHPRLVHAIAQHGHEVASHGYAHELITVQTPARFREDVRRAKGILEDIIGAPVLGYRAPSFTITQETSWALPILVEEGYVYDSSVSPTLPHLPIGPHRNGKPATDDLCQCLPTNAGTLWEIPPSTLQIAGVRMSIAGNGYFRLLPYGLLLRMLKRFETDDQRLVMCLRSWELDPDQPMMHGPLLSRFRHYVNLHKTEDRLIHLMNEFSFGPIREAIAPIRHLYEERGRALPRDWSFTPYQAGPESIGIFESNFEGRPWFV
jgi:polysaccharide deacetylase family protein (PEP-CTERM system associated)